MHNALFRGTVLAAAMTLLTLATAPLQAQAPPAGQATGAPSAGWGAVEAMSGIGASIGGIWTQVACIFSPAGIGCVVGDGSGHRAVRPQVGCSVDPSGQCKAPSIVRPQNSCSLDPSGQCKALGVVRPQNSCSADPSGKCISPAHHTPTLFIRP